MSKSTIAILFIKSQLKKMGIKIMKIVIKNLFYFIIFIRNVHYLKVLIIKFIIKPRLLY